jgi:hypothetical protein
MEEMPSLNTPVHRLKVATLPLDSPCCGPVTLPLDLPCLGPVIHSGEILTIGKSHRKKLLRFSLNADIDIKKVSRFKYATWNLRWLAVREGELDKFLNEYNIQISVITESKEKLQRTKETEHYTGIYSGVERLTRGQSGVIIWVHKSISNKIDHYIFWNDRVI